MSVNEVLITLTCPTCGAKLKLGKDTNLVYCTSCGNEHLVHHGEGSIYLAPMAADVAQIRTGVDKTAAELAVARLQKEIEGLNAQFTSVSESDYMAKIPSYARESWAMAAMIGCTALAFSFYAAHANTVAGCFAAGILLSFIFLAVARDKRRKQANALQVQELNDLDLAIDSKKAMLERNQFIANS